MGGASFKVTAALPATGYAAIAVHEYSGLASPIVVRQADGASGATGVATLCRPLEVNQIPELLVAAATSDDTISVLTGTAGAFTGGQGWVDVSGAGPVPADDGLPAVIAPELAVSSP